MQLELNQPIHVTYCTNIHAGETWEEIFDNIKHHTLRIRSLVAPGRKFGIGLRLSNEAARELADPETLKEFKAYLEDHALYVFTINAFPFGQFHDTEVKEQVYAPDWRSRERLQFTTRCADILTELVGEQGEGSISTAPGSFGEWIETRADAEAMAVNLAGAAYHLETIYRARGVNLHLGLEPEPLCVLENIDGTIEFFEDVLWPEGTAFLSQIYRIDPEEARALLGRRIGVCYDTCHMAVEFEPAAEAVRRLREAGVFISKYQISSALRLPAAEAHRLRRFADDVYLHQVIARMKDGSLRRWKDIAPALEDAAALADADELRVHCHVPLDMPEQDGLASTSDHITDLLRAIALTNDVSHFELETYTWDVLPDDVRGEDLDEAVAGEFRWFMDQLSAVEQTLSTTPH